jgi:hypothetical protein
MNQHQLSIRIESADLSIPIGESKPVIRLKGHLISPVKLHHSEGFEISGYPCEVAIDRNVHDTQQNYGYASLGRRAQGRFINATYSASPDSFDRISSLLGDISTVSYATLRIIDVAQNEYQEIIWRQPTAGSSIAELVVHRETQSLQTPR